MFPAVRVRPYGSLGGTHPWPDLRGGPVAAHYGNMGTTSTQELADLPL